MTNYQGTKNVQNMKEIKNETNCFACYCEPCAEQSEGEGKHLPIVILNLVLN